MPLHCLADIKSPLRFGKMHQLAGTQRESSITIPIKLMGMDAVKEM